MADPTFTEDEGRRILARATERQESVERARLRAGGSLTLAELTSIAREVDIDVELVQTAAAEVALRRDSKEPATTLGVPRTILHTRLLPGEVSDAAWERMVELFRETLGQGLASEYGGIREWSTTSAWEEAPLQVRLEPASDGTLVRFTKSNRSSTVEMPLVAAACVALGLVLAVLEVVGVLSGSGTLAAFFAGTGAAMGSGSLVWARWWSTRQRSRFDSVADKVELIARSTDT